MVFRVHTFFETLFFKPLLRLQHNYSSHFCFEANFLINFFLSDTLKDTLFKKVRKSFKNLLLKLFIKYSRSFS
jgi:hypothetical protein